MKKADIGLIGLAVMGENLIMNMESKGFTVACYNRTTEKVDNFPSLPVENSKIAFPPKPACVFRLRAS